MVVLSLSSPVTPPADTTTTSSTTVNGGSIGGCNHYPHSKNVSSRRFVAKAQANKVVVDGSTNAAPVPAAKSGASPLEKKIDGPSRESSTKQLASEESISQFMAQVADLVKLVVSRDIVELQLKQLDCEILIRKKEAIQQAHPPTPVVTMQSLPPAPPSPPAAAAPPPATLALPAPAAPKPAKSSLPPFKCPMAGTFYRCPGPGEPPFVKVGDKVQKGQVLCIIEAMKLMNEIEADQSGTIVEILAEDAKPVSVDTQTDVEYGSMCAQVYHRISCAHTL